MRITEAGITLARLKKLNLQITKKKKKKTKSSNYKTIQGNFSLSNWVTWSRKRCT